jgi:hypothetical protein
VVEGAPLLRAYTFTGIEGSNPFLSASSTRSCPFQRSELVDYIARSCIALHTLELDLLHKLLHILLHKVR